MTDLRPLRASDFDALHAAFSQAFSDYVIPFSVTPQQLQEMLTRRGWVPELSAAIFDEGRIVAFTANGFDGSSGYDSGTGVIPSHRRQGLARRVMEASRDLLRAAGAQRYVLEVIESNVAAARLYLDLGFRETRRLQCWSFTDPEPQPIAPVGDEIAPADARAMWDVDPSWQNSSCSVARAGDPHVTLREAGGYAIVFPINGDLAQLAVAKDARRRGVGRQLLSSAAAAAGKPLRIINVDDSNAAIAAFLEAAGATRTVRQLELMLQL